MPRGLGSPGASPKVHGPDSVVGSAQMATFALSHPPMRTAGFPYPGTGRTFRGAWNLFCVIASPRDRAQDAHREEQFAGPRLERAHSLAFAARARDHEAVTSRRSPAPDFPIYGLTEATWDGPRWLRFYEGAIGEVPVGIHLAHGRSKDLFADGGPWAEVRSLPRSRFVDSEQGRESLVEVALYAWMSRGFGSADVHDELAHIEAGGYQDWSTARWTLDGHMVEALVAPDHSDAHGSWAAFTSTPEVYVVVIARGIRPADIRLTRVLDGATYGMSVGAMLDFPDSIEESIKKALGSAASD
jgi:hypothetical protein